MRIYIRAGGSKNCFKWYFYMRLYNKVLKVKTLLYTQVFLLKFEWKETGKHPKVERIHEKIFLLWIPTIKIGFSELNRQTFQRNRIYGSYSCL